MTDATYYEINLVINRTPLHSLPISVLHVEDPIIAHIKVHKFQSVSLEIGSEAVIAEDSVQVNTPTSGTGYLAPCCYCSVYLTPNLRQQVYTYICMLCLSEYSRLFCYGDN